VTFRSVCNLARVDAGEVGLCHFRSPCVSRNNPIVDRLSGKANLLFLAPETFSL
jgi:hypothetical protein